MAQRFFCDLCDEQCSGAPTRRWEKVSGEMGLEVVILRGSNPVNGEHLCDECVTKMFWDMVEKHRPNQGLSRLKDAIKQKEIELHKRELAVASQLNDLTALKQQIDDKERSFKSREEELSKAGPIIEQARIARQREPEVIRLAEARGKQQAIDEFDKKRRRSEGR
jgi:hypothetical protein